MKPHFRTTVFLILCFLVSGGATAADHFLTTSQGTRYQDIKPGEGEAAEFGDVVTMHFVGWLDADGGKGKEIYNSRREREPVSFVVGTDGVMQGWSDGVIGMKPGGKRLLMLPPALGYGSKGVEGVIPPDARLIFVIDVIAIEKSPD
jgi:FKBP-type peptidyl-prolyl cis-trans isomerase